MILTDQNSAQAVDAIGQRINLGDEADARWQVAQRKQRARQEEQRHDQKIHDQLEALHVVQDRSDGCPECGEDQGDEKHHQER